jgi:hypothetical protein
LKKIYLEGQRPGNMRALVFFCALAMTVVLGGCAGISAYNCKIPRDPSATCYGDRCYIEDSTFILADQLYSKFGSLWLVERHLREEEQLLDCEINECLYRLKKVHSLP